MAETTDRPFADESTETIAEQLYIASHFHDDSPNPDADLMREAATRLLAAERDAARYLDAIFAMADDGWLACGVEGLSEVQKLVHEIAQEHPEYKRRAALSGGVDESNAAG